MRAFRASSSSLSPSWKSMARLALPSRLELKRPEGSFREAPLAKVIFTTFLYVSPVQISPLCDHTGVPLHFHSSATSGSASLIRARSRESISPLQPPRSSILASISSDGDSALFDRFFFMLPASPWVAFPLGTQFPTSSPRNSFAHSHSRSSNVMPGSSYPTFSIVLAWWTLVIEGGQAALPPASVRPG